jgi:NIMA (never in mitosis gene a)-related kinase
MEKPYDFKSDIWSLGCVVYEMCSLRPPFKSNNMKQLFQKVITASYPPIPSKYSKDLTEILKCTLQIDHKKRLNCDQLLNHPIIVKKMVDLDFKPEESALTFNYTEDQSTLNSSYPNLHAHESREQLKQNLLETIRLPKTLRDLKHNLPHANYTPRNEPAKHNL